MKTMVVLQKEDRNDKVKPLKNDYNFISENLFWLKICNKKKKK